MYLLTKVASHCLELSTGNIEFVIRWNIEILEITDDRFA